MPVIKLYNNAGITRLPWGKYFSTIRDMEVWLEELPVFENYYIEYDNEYNNEGATIKTPIAIHIENPEIAVLFKLTFGL